MNNGFFFLLTTVFIYLLHTGFALYKHICWSAVVAFTRHTQLSIGQNSELFVTVISKRLFVVWCKKCFET